MKRFAAISSQSALRSQALALAALGAIALAAAGGYLAADRWVGPAATATLAPGPSQVSNGRSTAAVRSASAVPAQRPGEPSEIDRRRPNVAAGGAAIDAMWEWSLLNNSIVPGAVAGPPIPEGWRIGGVFETERGLSAIVTFDGASPPRYLQVGELLPNKAVIVALTRDTVTVRTLVNKRWILVALDV